MSEKQEAEATAEKTEVAEGSEDSNKPAAENKSEESTSEAAKQNSSNAENSSAETEAKDGNENKKEDVTSVVAKHYNEIEEKGVEARASSRIFYLRNFNNWTKSMLIGEFLDRLKKEKGPRTDLTVLDIGCGKGGDLLKWKKGNIKRLICADIAEVSLEQCKQRYREMSNRGRRGWNRGDIYSAEFIAADCTKVRLKDKYKNPNIQFDLVSAQFSFHYCFESIQQAECMIQNASECLRPGGYFIGTTPDGHDIMKRLKESSDLSFGNDVYSVTFESKEDLPLFGAKYNFHLEGVVDCPEFLVYFPAFEKIAADNGLKLVYKKKFDDVFEEFRNSQDGSFLLHRMQALETYPPFENEKSLGTSASDYEVAEKKIEELKSGTQEGKEGKSDKKGQPRVGTLSKSEWEAISMYIAFAFVKAKPESKDGEKKDVKKRKPSGSKSDTESQEKRMKKENGSPEKEDGAAVKDESQKSDAKAGDTEKKEDNKT